MAKYSSKPTVINRPASALAAKFADFSTLNDSLAALPEEERAKVGNVEFTCDTIKIVTPQVGDIVLKAVERTDSRVRLQAQNSPVPMTLEVDLKPVSDDSTEVTGTIDVDIPVMLRPLVGPSLQKAADQFGTLFANLA